MNVSELFSLTNWITAEIVETQIPQKYQALQQILQQHSQPNKPNQSFEAQKEALIDAISQVPLQSLTRDQVEFLNDLGIGKSVGEDGVNFIEDILYKNVIDVATSANKLNQVFSQVSEGVQKSDQIKAGLKDCIKEDTYEIESEVLIRVSFTGHASMSNISEFKSWGKIWYDIGRGIAMVNNSAPEDVRIVGATNGSIVIELAVIASIATTASTIILQALKVAAKVWTFGKKLRRFEIYNSRIKSLLQV